MPVTTLNKRRLLSDLKNLEFRRLFHAEHINNALPFQIRELRKQRGLTQKALAALIGKNQKNISDWENPNYEYKPQIGTLISLADAFDVPLIVRFGSWEEVWDWEHSISPRKLAPSKFDEALPALEEKLREELAGKDEQATSDAHADDPIFRLVDAPQKPAPTQPKFDFMYTRPADVAPPDSPLLMSDQRRRQSARAGRPATQARAASMGGYYETFVGATG